MDQSALVSAVQETARIDDHHTAEEAVHAVLGVLGERVGGSAGDLASQLPGGLKEAMPRDGAAERFGPEEFCQRVVARGPAQDETAARRHVRAVLAGLRAAVQPGAYDHLVDQLPADYEDLLGGGPVNS